MYSLKCNALVLAAEKPIKKEIINLVGENHQIIDIAKEITDNQKIISDKQDNRSYNVNNQKIKKELNWEPMMNIENTIKEFKKIRYAEDVYHNEKWEYS